MLWVVICKLAAGFGTGAAGVEKEQTRMSVLPCWYFGPSGLTTGMDSLSAQLATILSPT